MNQKQILNALNPLSSQVKGYVSKMTSVIKLLSELKDLQGYKVELLGEIGNKTLVDQLPFIDETKYQWNNKHIYHEKKRSQQNAKSLFGEFATWQKIRISHNAGTYNLNVPMHNDFYYYFLSLIDMSVNVVKEKINPLGTILIDSSIFKSFAVAAKFVSKDDLRPALQNVCIAMEKGKVEIVATDCHKLYRSELKECNATKRSEILVSVETAKAISKIKTIAKFAELNLLPDYKIEIEGQVFDTFTGSNFPEYRVVMPEYNKFMEFQKQTLIDKVKQVLPHANRQTNQVSFHLNGSIALHCQDVDFSMESDTDMPYLSKTLPDMDIAFNGKMLNECLSTFKDKTLKMYSEGNPRAATLISNGKETVLLMPLLIK